MTRHTVRLPVRAPRSDGERNRARLLEVAAALFAERGPAVSVAEVAQRAGVGTGTLYRHFASKDDLALAVALDRLSGLIEDVRAVVTHDEGGGAQAQLRSMLTVLFDGLCQDRGLLAVVREQLTRAPELGVLRRRLRAAVQGPLAAAQRDGCVRPDVTVADVVTLVSSLAHPGDAQDADPRRHLAIALDGLRAPLR